MERLGSVVLVGSFNNNDSNGKDPSILIALHSFVDFGCKEHHWSKFLQLHIYTLTFYQNLDCSNLKLLVFG